MFCQFASFNDGFEIILASFAMGLTSFRKICKGFPGFKSFIKKDISNETRNKQLIIHIKLSYLSKLIDKLLLIFNYESIIY